MMSSHMFICPKCKGCFSIEDGKSTICPSCNQPMSRTVYTRDEWRALSVEQRQGAINEVILQAKRERNGQTQEAIEQEREKASYALENSNQYEYEVVIVPNMPDGGVDRESINRILTERSNSGWQLVTAYSNELGHNSSSGGFGGFSAGTNTTVCQDVLYFRRLIANVDR